MGVRSYPPACGPVSDRLAPDPVRAQEGRAAMTAQRLSRNDKSRPEGLPVVVERASLGVRFESGPSFDLRLLLHSFGFIFSLGPALIFVFVFIIVLLIDQPTARVL